MATLVTVDTSEITIALSGLSALPARRRIVRIPLAAVTAVRHEGAPSPDMAGTGVSGSLTGTNVRTVHRDGKSILIAVRPGHPTIRLDLDREGFPRIPYDAVVLSVDLTPGSHSID